jgi:hypothetical protein
MAKDLPTPAGLAIADSPPVVEPAATAPAPPAKAPEKGVFLARRTSEDYGPKGGFVDLTEDEAKAAVTSGTLRPATAAEIARRRR